MSAAHRRSGSSDLEVAGIRFRTTCDAAPILTTDEPWYRSFHDAGGGEEADLEVFLELDGVPCPAPDARVFDSGESWSMYRDGTEYLLSMDPPRVDGPAVWMARFDRGVRRVTVYCGDPMMVDEGGSISLTNPVRYPLDQILLMYHLARRGGVVLHAAGVDMNGRGLVFPGRSGAGKSTLSLQLVGRESLTLLSDDRIVVRRVDGEFRAFGTPWPGEAGAALNRSVALSGIYFLCQASANRLVPITPAEAVERLLPVTSVPWYDAETMMEVLGCCDELVRQVPAFELHFVPDVAVAEVLEEQGEAMMRPSTPGRTGGAVVEGL